MILAVIALVALAGALAAYALAPAVRNSGLASPARVERLELEEERDALYALIRDLDRDLAEGLVEPAEHRRLRLRSETRAAAILERLESLPPAPAVTPSSRPVWPLAAALLAAFAAGGVLVGTYAVWPLQALALPSAEVRAIEAARRLPALEAKLNAEARADPKRGARTESLLEFGEAAWVAQDYARAARAYTAILQRDPRDATALARYGTLLFFAGRNDEALEVLDLAIEREPNAEAYLTKGNLLFSAKDDPAGAIRAWEEYRRLAGEDASERVADLIVAARARLEATDPGAKLFAQNCAGCHGSEGQGVIGPKLAGNPRARDRALVTRQVRNGKGEMPAFPKLSGEDLERLASFVTRLAARPGGGER